MNIISSGGFPSHMVKDVVKLISSRSNSMKRFTVLLTKYNRCFLVEIKKKSINGILIMEVCTIDHSLNEKFEKTISLDNDEISLYFDVARHDHFGLIKKKLKTIKKHVSERDYINVKAFIRQPLYNDEDLVYVESYLNAVIRNIIIVD